MSTDVSSVTKHFPSPQNGFITSLTSTIASGAVTVPLNSVAGYTNSQTVVMVIEPAGLKQQTFTGVIDTGAVAITGVIWTAGSNTTHTGGVTVVDYATATHIAMMTKGILVDHGQAGNHTKLSDANGNEWLKVSTTASAVNEITIMNAAAGNAPRIQASGDDTAIDLDLKGKGSGRVTADGLPLLTVSGEMTFDHVYSGGVWTADSAGVNRNASMTFTTLYLNGRRLQLLAVTAHTFTASKDTYVDILDNQDGTASLVYTEVSNNAASPALAANSIRMAIVVTAAGSIAATGSINQGQEDRILPIASSIAYSVTDSLGNLICPRDPRRRVLGYREILATFNAGTSSTTDVTGLSVPVIIPTGRKIRITVLGNLAQNGTGRDCYTRIRESSTQLSSGAGYSYTSGAFAAVCVQKSITASAGSHTYKASIDCDVGANVSAIASSDSPHFIRVELV